MQDTKLDFWIKKNYNVLFEGKHGVGKAQPLSAKIKTPSGWTTMGEIKAGDFVSTPDGKTVEVLGVFPQGKKKVYRVNFMDGRSAECCDEHLWKVLSFQRPKKGGDSHWKDDTFYVDNYKWRVMNTREIIQQKKHGKRSFLRIPLIQEDNIPDRKFYIDPYLLGCIIGDGGRSHEKFIPDEYKAASYQQKIHLIQGLMDTDGYVGKNGSLSFSTTSKQLATDFVEVVRSIGGITSIRSYIPYCTHKGVQVSGKRSYTISVRYRNPSALLRLPHKKDRCPKNYQYKDLTLEIKSVRSTGRFEECKCISVNHPDQLYITNDYVVTHNTARIIAAFERAKLKWKYFSASTLDPWVDFVGVPKEVTNEKGIPYIELIRPKCFADDDVEAIFLDEYNRSQPKVRNATMELVQFKSINGRKFSNLKIVWVAINPDSDGENDTEITYDVEKLDPAQRDRFHVQVQVPYKPDLSFFRERFGVDLGTSAVSWWNELEEKEKLLVSPRRLEYALQMYTDNGDVRDVLPNKINVSKLITELKNGSYRKRMDDIFKTGDVDAATQFIQDENNYNSTVKYICEDGKKVSFFLPLMSEEKQVVLVSNNVLAQDHAFSNYSSFDRVIAAAAADKKVQKRLATYIRSAAQNAPLDVSKLTFASAATKVKKAPSAYTGYQSTDVTSLCASYSSFIAKGTTYRKQFFDSLTVTLIDSYIKPGIVLKLSEAQLAANALYSIITSTSDYTVMAGFYGFDSVFAYVHKALKDAGDTTTLSNCKDIRVTEYVKNNLARFV